MAEKLTLEKFQEAMERLQDRAKKNHLYLEMDDIRSEIEGLDLDEEKIAMVVQFLRSKKIAVGGEMQKAESGDESRRITVDEIAGLSDAERQFVTGYQEMLEQSGAPEPGTEEFAAVFRNSRNGDPAAEQKLISGLLYLALAEAVKAYDGSVQLPDLVQDASLRLVDAVKTSAGEEQSAETLTEKMRGVIRAGLQASADEQADRDLRDRRMVQRVEAFRDSLDILKKELGRKVYLDEVAEYMDISEDEAEDIMRLAGEQMPDGDGGDGMPDGDGEDATSDGDG